MFQLRYNTPIEKRNRHSTVLVLGGMSHDGVSHMTNLDFTSFVELRIFPRIAATDNINDCWEWTGRRNKGGYGSIVFARKSYLIHRLIYELFYGSTKGQIVCHKCDNPSCVNPFHLFIGTQQDNIRDRTLKCRTQHKLSPSQVLAIRSEYLKNTDRKYIGKKYGIAANTVYKIVTRRTWDWLYPQHKQEADE